MTLVQNCSARCEIRSICAPFVSYACGITKQDSIMRKSEGLPPSLHFRLSDPAALPSSAQLQMLPENLRTKLRLTQPNGRNKKYPLLQTSSCQILAAQCVVVSTLKILSKSTVRWLMTGVVPYIATSKEHAEASGCSSVTFSFPPSLCRSDPTWLF
jgi:hypothetical protein